MKVRREEGKLGEDEEFGARRQPFTHSSNLFFSSTNFT